MRTHISRQPTQLDALAAIFALVLLIAFVHSAASIAAHAARTGRGIPRDESAQERPMPREDGATLSFRTRPATERGGNPSQGTAQDGSAATPPSSRPQREEG